MTKGGRSVPAPTVPVEWELPRLRYSLTFQDDDRYADDAGSDTEFFDVKFYPYSPPGSNPVFAAVSKRHVFVCRLTPTKDGNPCEIIRVIRDDDDDALNCSCTWTKDPETERALLCVAGRDAKVKVYNVRDGKAVASFVGHGGEINDLATSPANPYLVASASDDTTVRIWSLDPVHKEQPCVCLLGGEGHSWNLLSVAFHDSGRYVLSAGHDQVINLWTLPDIPKEHMEVPIIVHFPHFSSSEIHTGLIDCVAFYGDMILSRACYEEVIVLWRIEGFDSSAPPPTPEQAPSNQDATKVTRSAFNTLPPASLLPSSSSASASASAALASSATPQYTRLLQLDTPGCGPQFFMRFGLFNMAGHHPTLAFCNATAKIYFWDFTCFSAYRDFVKACARRDRESRESGQNNSEGPVPRPPWLKVIAARKRPARNASHNNGQASSAPHLPGGRRLRDTNGPGIGIRDFGDRADAASDRDSSVFSSVAPGGGAAGTGTPDPESAAAATNSLADGPSGLGKNGAGGVGGGFTIEDLYNMETIEDWSSRYSTDDPHARVKAHKVETNKGLSAVGRQVAWSPEGEWCVVVGSNSRLMVLQRWAKGDAHAVDDGER